jgi:hypothetical protein
MRTTAHRLLGPPLEVGQSSEWVSVLLVSVLSSGAWSSANLMVGGCGFWGFSEPQITCCLISYLILALAPGYVWMVPVICFHFRSLFVNGLHSVFVELVIMSYLITILVVPTGCSSSACSFDCGLVVKRPEFPRTETRLSAPPW